MFRQLRTLLVLSLLGLAVALPSTAAAANGERPVLAATDGDELVPGFDWSVRTYAARCGGDGLSLDVDGARRWKVAIGSAAPRKGDFSEAVDIASGEDVRISYVRRNGKVRNAYVRCLPEDMFDFDFKTVREGGPKLFAVQISPSYGVVMSRAGAPVWWLDSQGPPFDTKIYPDGTVGWNAGGQDGVVDYGLYEIRTLTGKLTRTIGSATGGFIDVHGFGTLPNGSVLVGAPTFVDGVDLTGYGGSASARVRNTAIEELTPAGDLVRSWDSGDHIGLDETPARWWEPIVAANPANYDVSHWNSVDVVGKYMYLSFRHLDAVYKVNRRSGRIIWKLGGTKTNKSLEVRGDPRGDDPLNGQHDARVLEDGTVTVFDNSTRLSRPPRAVQYRINEDKGIARMVTEVTDPKVTVSGAGGSVRRLDDGWLINWGVSNPGRFGAYNERGKPIFRLTYNPGASYRANVVPGSITFADLRKAMDRMSR
jgi:hypothetical protein